MPNYSQRFLKNVVALATCLAVLASMDQTRADFILTSPAVTDFGDWTSWSECPLGYFVVGGDVHMTTHYDDQNKPDDLGLVNVVLECRNIFAPPEEPQVSEFIFTQVNGVTATVSTLHSPYNVSFATFSKSHKGGHVHHDGEDDAKEEDKGRSGIVNPITIQYTRPLRTLCEGVVIGVELNLAPEELARDNSAANNLRLHCSGLVGNEPSYVEAYGEYKGAWGTAMMCAPGQAVCGIQAQADDFGANLVDHFGINNLRFKCCRVPNPATTCVATDDWELIEECNNLEGAESFTCSYTKQIGVGASSTKSNSHYDQYLLNEGLGFNIQEGSQPFWLSSGLSENFRVNVGLSPVTEHDWVSGSEKTWTLETSIETTVSIPPYTQSSIYQVVGKCSYFTARAAHFRKVDATKQA